MEITEKLKNKHNNAKSADKMQAVLQEAKEDTGKAGAVLSDEDLETVSGGGGFYHYSKKDRPI